MESQSEFSLLQEKTQNPKPNKQKIMVLKALDTRQESTVIPEKWETNEVSSVVIPGYCLEKVSKPCTGRGSQVEPARLPEL